MKVIVNIKAETSSGNRKGWLKLLTGVDESQKGGYALLGEFLSDGEHSLEVGDIVAECYHTGSVKNGGKVVQFGRVQPDGSIKYNMMDTARFYTPQESESMKVYAQNLLNGPKEVEDPIEIIKSLLLTSELNSDDLEQDTRDLIARAQKLIEKKS